MIAAEDTRKAAQLLKRIEVGKKHLVSYYDPVEVARSEQLIAEVAEGTIRSIALISDAGTPGIADPGYRLVRLARQRGIPVIPVPGPSALAALVSISGLPCDRLHFVGFLPRKEAALNAEFARWRSYGGSVVAFESTRRLLTSLESLAVALPNAEVAIGRELTKTHEETLTGSVNEVLDWARGKTEILGEVALMVNPNEVAQDIGIDEALHEKIAICVRHGMTQREIATLLGDRGVDKKTLYKLIILAKDIP